MTSIAIPRNNHYAESEGYLISLLSLMNKIILTLLGRNIGGGGSLQYVPNVYKSAYKLGRPRNSQCTM